MPMDSSKQCVVWGTVSLVMRLSKFTGTAPVKFTKKRDQVLMIISTCLSKWSYILSFVITTAMLVALVRDSLLPEERSIRMTSGMGCAIWAIDLAILLVITNVGMCGATARTKQLILFINKIDLILIHLNKNQPLRKSEKGLCILYVILLCIATLLFVVDIKVNHNKALQDGQDLSKSEDGKVGFYFQFPWLLHHLIKILSLLEPGHLIQKEIGHTLNLVGKLLARVDFTNEPLVSELKLFLRELCLNTVSCNLLGICVLTRPLVAKLLRFITTYFVVVIANDYRQD